MHKHHINREFNFSLTQRRRVEGFEAIFLIYTNRKLCWPNSCGYLATPFRDGFIFVNDV